MNGYFAALEQELIAAAERLRTAPDLSGETARRRRRGGRRMRLAAATLGLVVIAGVPAAAVTGVFRPHREADGLVRLTKRVTIAGGTTPDGRHWELLSSQSDLGFCFGIRLPIGVPGDDGTYVGEGCGKPPPGSFTISTVSGGSLRQNGLAYGMAPDGATRVRVKARGIEVTVETVDDRIGLDGRFYVAELPTHKSFGPTTVVALDDDGVVLGETGIG